METDFLDGSATRPGTPENGGKDASGKVRKQLQLEGVRIRQKRFCASGKGMGRDVWKVHEMLSARVLPRKGARADFFFKRAFLSRGLGELIGSAQDRPNGCMVPALPSARFPLGLEQVGNGLQTLARRAGGLDFGNGHLLLGVVHEPRRVEGVGLLAKGTAGDVRHAPAVRLVP
jgi:hypothetical protein